MVARRISRRSLSVIVGVLACLSACTENQEMDRASEPVRIVGSSTVFPFSARVAEVYSNQSGTPVIVERTGSGGGHKFFCSDAGNGRPDATNSSRPQKRSEYDLCRRNGVSPVVEIQIGYDGIVLARSRGAETMSLDLDELYLATAKHVPRSVLTSASDSASSCDFVPNPFERWSDISADLPGERIELYGPPPTSGTRDAFVETALERGARDVPCMATLEVQDNLEFQRRVRALREDGRWIDSGENDSTLIQILINTPSAVGVMGFSFLDQNRDKVQGVTINDTLPEFGAILEGRYPIVRSLFVYFNGQSLRDNPSVRDYALEFISEAASGPNGYLEAAGLIPLSPDLRATMRPRIIERLDYRDGQADAGRSTQ